MTKTTVYILVRQDISPVQQAVQACHAAWELGLEHRGNEETSRLVLLAVADENTLLREAEKLAFNGLHAKLFFEPDFGMGHSALAVWSTEAERKHFSHLERVST